MYPEKEKSRDSHVTDCGAIYARGNRYATPPPPRVDAFPKRFFWERPSTEKRSPEPGPPALTSSFYCPHLLLLFTDRCHKPDPMACLWAEGLPVSGTKICKEIQTPLVRRPSAWAVDTAAKIDRRSTVVNGVTHENGPRFRKPFRPFGREYFRKTGPPAFRKAARPFLPFFRVPAVFEIPFTYVLYRHKNFP